MYIVGTHLTYLGEALLVSTHNAEFDGKFRFFFILFRIARFFFLFSTGKYSCGTSTAPRRDASNGYPQEVFMKKLNIQYYLNDPNTDDSLTVADSNSFFRP